MNVIELLSLIFGAIALAGLLHTYLLYPLSLLFISLFRARRNRIRIDPAYTPTVAILCSAHNEEDVIEQKIDNALAIEYPPNALSIHIASDGSTDRTDEIIRRRADGVRVHAHIFERGGKAKAMNTLVSSVDAEIVVLTDANTMYTPDTIRMLVRHFADPIAGCVCGNLALISKRKFIGALGEQQYWNVETWLKKMEGAIESTLGATGAIYALRRALFTPIPTEYRIADDLFVPLMVATRGYRCLFDADAHAYEETSARITDEFHRKIRNANGSFNVMPHIREIFPKLSFFLKYAVVSHKLLRWISPWLLIAVFAASLVLTLFFDANMWIVLAQAILYAIGLLGWGLERIGVKIPLLTLPVYFVAIHTSLLIGWFTRSTAGRSTTWSTPRESGR